MPYTHHNILMIFKIIRLLYGLVCLILLTILNYLAADLKKNIRFSKKLNSIKVYVTVKARTTVNPKIFQ